MSIKIRKIEVKARELYETPDNGLDSMAAVAKHMGKSLSSVQGWAKKAKERGMPWKKPKIATIVKGNIVRKTKPGVDHKDAKITVEKGGVRKTFLDPAAIEEQLGKDVIDEIMENPDLRDREKLFCIHFIGNFNPRAAAIKAGFSPNTAQTVGLSLLRKKAVKAEIVRLKELYAYNNFMDIQRIINRHVSIAFSDMGDFVEYGTETKPVYNEDGDVVSYEEKPFFRVKPTEEVDSSLIKTIKAGKYGIEVTLEDRSKSLEFLGKLLSIPSKLENEKLSLLKKKLEIDSEFTAEKVLEIIKSLPDNELNKLTDIEETIDEDIENE